MAHVLLVDDDPACLAALAQRLRFGFREQRLEVDVADSAALHSFWPTPITTTP
jgi:hypothetical protein